MEGPGGSEPFNSLEINAVPNALENCSTRAIWRSMTLRAIEGLYREGLPENRLSYWSGIHNDLTVYPVSIGNFQRNLLFSLFIVVLHSLRAPGAGLHYIGYRHAASPISAQNHQRSVSLQHYRDDRCS